MLILNIILVWHLFRFPFSGTWFLYLDPKYSYSLQSLRIYIVSVWPGLQRLIVVNIIILWNTSELRSVYIFIYTLRRVSNKVFKKKNRGNTMDTLERNPIIYLLFVSNFSQKSCFLTSARYPRRYIAFFYAIIWFKIRTWIYYLGRSNDTAGGPFHIILYIDI